MAQDGRKSQDLGGRFERLYREDHEKLCGERRRNSFTTKCRKTLKAATGIRDCEGSVLF
jgi:hypothetical protein